MVTDKTPAHKRIARAEKGREEWKMKAIERREEAEKLKLDLELNETRLSFSEQRLKELKDKLDAAEHQIANQQKMIESLKKNSSK
jgi:chromosome segregation ATPase